MPAPAAPAAPAARQDGTDFTLRYQGDGWLGLTQATAAALGCATGAECGTPAEADPSAAPAPDPELSPASAVWLDVDDDPDTFNSSSASLPVPPRAAISWAGLYWSADRAAAPDEAPRCDNTPESAPPATEAPAPELANQVNIKINGDAYRTVTAAAFTEVTSPRGGEGYQAYADITDLLRPLQAPDTPGQAIITVADLQAAQGVGCTGGWSVLMAYSYPDGRDTSYAPNFRHLTIYDGQIPTSAGTTTEVTLSDLAAPTKAPVDALVSLTLRSTDPGLVPTGFSVNGAALAAPTGTGGDLGYTATDPLETEAIEPAATSASLSAHSPGDGYLTAIVAVSTRAAASVNLNVTALVEPETARVGAPVDVTMTVRNTASLPASGVSVTLHLPDGLVIVGPPDGFDAVAGVWTVGRVEPGATATLTVGLRVTQAGRHDVTVEVTASDLPNAATAKNAGAVLAATSSEPGPAQATAESGRKVGSSLPTTVSSAVLFGVGLIALGALILFVVVLRNRDTAG